MLSTTQCFNQRQTAKENKMSAFKEELIVLEALAKKQTRLYNHSADFGICFDNHYEEQITTTRMAVKRLLDLPGSKVVYKSNKPYVQRQYRLRVMWSCSEATDVDFRYFEYRGKKYFSIFFSNVRL
jgi:hypothetical protein